MIKVLFYKKQDFFIGFKSSGHAGSQMPEAVRKQLERPEEFGNIVCSAVSVLVYHVQIGLMQIEKIQKEQMFIKEEKGEFELRITDEILYKKVQTYFINFLLTLKQLQKQYHNSIIIEEAVHVT